MLASFHSDYGTQGYEPSLRTAIYFIHSLFRGVVMVDMEALIKEIANEMALPQTVKHTTKAEIALQVILKYYDLTPKGHE